MLVERGRENSSFPVKEGLGKPWVSQCHLCDDAEISYFFERIIAAHIEDNLKRKPPEASR